MAASTPVAHAVRQAARRLPGGQPPVARLLALVQSCHRFDPSVPPRHVFVAIRQAVPDDPAVVKLLDDERVRLRVARHVWSAAPSDASSGRVAAARRLAAHVLAPSDLTPARARKVRVMTALVGARLLDAPHGWDTTLVTGPRVALDLGLGKPSTARAWVRGAADAGAVTVRQRRAGGGLVLALRRLSAAEREVVLDHVALVDDLALTAEFGARPDTDPAAVVIAAVAHPLWSYGPLEHAAWEAWLSKLTGADIVHSAAIGKALRALREAGVDPDAPADRLMGMLDVAAARIGADSAAVRAAEAAERASDERLADLERARQRAEVLRPVLAAIMRDCPAPTPPADAAERAGREEWLVRAHTLAASLPPAALPHLERRLVRLLLRTGFDPDRAAQVGERIARGDGRQAA